MTYRDKLILDKLSIFDDVSIRKIDTDLVIKIEISKATWDYYQSCLVEVFFHDENNAIRVRNHNISYEIISEIIQIDRDSKIGKILS